MTPPPPPNFNPRRGRWELVLTNAYVRVYRDAKGNVRVRRRWRWYAGAIRSLWARVVAAVE